MDGYNVINAWPKLKEIGRVNLEEARDQLIQQLVEYKHFTGKNVRIVFDAHYVKGNSLKKFFVKDVEVIFTKEHETADSYIEKMVERLTKNRRNFVVVATSDWAEQQIVLGSGATRISARELKIELKNVTKKISKKTSETRERRMILQDRLDEKTVEILEKWRRDE